MAPFVKPNSILMGDFNCVEDIALDTRRSSSTPYENTGADILTYISVLNQLTDQMRYKLGYHFNFTRSESDSTGRYCSTRIDRHYLPIITNHIWDSEITDLLIVDSDHSAVKSTPHSAIPGEDVIYNNDLITINPRILEINKYRNSIEKLIKDHIDNNVNTNIIKSINTLKYKVRGAMHRMSKEYTKRIKEEIKTIKDKIVILHETQRHKPQQNYEQRKAELFERKQEAAIKLTAPNQSLSYYKTLSGEHNSTKFWRRIFPITRGRKGIIKINKVTDWNNPPPKNTSTPPYTQEIAEEAANYYEHLYSPQIENNQTINAKHRLIKNIKEWGVENTTSQAAGEDIKEEKISKVMTFLPKGKAPGPDRIPNEFYSAFANLLAPIYMKFFNHIHQNTRTPKGFANGLISILHKKGTREDIRNYRPITLLNSDYKVLTRILAHRSRALATQFVSNDQIGFVPNTFIAESTLLINMIQAHLDK
eukprot:4922058-Pleurochrysis_carterae.AAC.1